MSTKNISVSIIMPVYNGEHYLRQCIASILTQTMQSIELIIINDGSNDGSRDILQTYEREYNQNKPQNTNQNNQQKNMVIVHQENKGRMKAREIGLSLANGEFIGFVDCDDYVEETMYATLYDTAISQKSDIVSCGFMNVNEDGSIIQKQVFPNTFDEVRSYKILADNPPSMCNSIFRRTLFENKDIIFATLERGEDLAIVPCLFYYATQTTMLAEAYYYYRNINKEHNTTRCPINLLKDLEHIEDLCEAGTILASFYKNKQSTASDLIPYTLKFPDFFNRYNFKYVKSFFHTHTKWEWYITALLQFIIKHKAYYTAMKLHLKEENRIVVHHFETIFTIDDEEYIAQILQDTNQLRHCITRFIKTMRTALRQALYKRIIKKIGAMFRTND